MEYHIATDKKENVFYVHIFSIIRVECFLQYQWPSNFSAEFTLKTVAKILLLLTRVPC